MEKELPAVKVLELPTVLEMAPVFKKVPTRADGNEAIHGAQAFAWSLFEEDRLAKSEVLVMEILADAEAAKKAANPGDYYNAEDGPDAGRFQYKGKPGSVNETMPAFLRIVRRHGGADIQKSADVLEQTLQVAVLGKGDQEPDVLTYAEWNAGVREKAIEDSKLSEADFDQLSVDKQEKFYRQAEIDLGGQIFTTVAKEAAEPAAEATPEQKDPFAEADKAIKAEARRLLQDKDYQGLLCLMPALAGKSASARIEVLDEMKSQASGPEQEKAIQELIDSLTPKAESEPEELVLLTEDEKKALLVGKFEKLYETDPEQAILLSLQHRRQEAERYKAQRIKDKVNLVQIEREVAAFYEETKSLQAKVADVVGELNPFRPEELLEIVNLEPNDENLAIAKEVTDKLINMVDEMVAGKIPISDRFKKSLKLLCLLAFLSPMPIRMITETEETATH